MRQRSTSEEFAQKRKNSLRASDGAIEAHSSTEERKEEREKETSAYFTSRIGYLNVAFSDRIIKAPHKNTEAHLVLETVPSSFKLWSCGSAKIILLILFASHGFTS